MDNEIKKEEPAEELLENEVLSEEAEQEEQEELAISKIESLKGEIASLEEELAKKKAESDREAKDYAEFRELYPEADISSLPPFVAEQVDSGVPLAAAYALYEKKEQKRSLAARAHNKATEGGAFGVMGRSSENGYFTPDEVRSMSRAEVKANYQKILESMKNWH